MAMKRRKLSNPLALTRFGITKALWPKGHPYAVCVYALFN